MARNMMKGVIVMGTAIALLCGLGAWSAHSTHRSRPGVGTDPGGVRESRERLDLKPATGNLLVGFGSGCFWGAEEAFRRVPGVVATAVGYSGGSSAYPSYEVAHATGHVETVLVEFNPRRTSLSTLLAVFWTLPRSRTPEAAQSTKSSYRATIWTYDSHESYIANKSKAALEKTLRFKLGAKILPARTFYLAEEYHQQYDEKAGKDLCNVAP